MHSTFDKAAELLRLHGRNSLSWQILNPGTSLWLSRDGEAVTGYVLQGKTRIAGGAPVTEPANLKRAALEFEEEARREGQSVCYFGAETWLKEVFEEDEGHRIVLLGAQPVWNPRLWQETLSQKPSVRELIRYASRRGVTVEETPAAEAESGREYEACLNEWLTSRKLPVLKFLIDPDVLSNTYGRRFFSARREGKLIGFLSLAPVAGRKGWLIEHIFRGRNAVRGMNELLADFAMKTVAGEGADFATLGLAPLSQKAGLSYRMNPVWLRVAYNWLYARASNFYNFSGLDAFKSKFRPHRWEPVYAIINKERFCPFTFYRILGAFCSTSPVLFAAAAVTSLLNGLME